MVFFEKKREVIFCVSTITLYEEILVSCYISTIIYGYRGRNGYGLNHVHAANGR